MLDAVSRALQLDETERAHLLDLARAADGIPTSGRSRRRTPSKAASRPSLHWTLEAIKDGVAFVRDRHQNILTTNSLGRAFYTPVIGDGGRLPNLARFQFLDPASRDFYPDWDLFAEMCVGIMRTDAGRDPRQDLVAVNDLGRAFYSPVIGDGGRTPNLARFQFLDPASRDFYPDWDLFAQMCVGIMRTDAGRDPHDRGLQDLVGELSTHSETFRRLWADHNVRSHGTGTKRFNHPVVGELTLAYEELAITAEPGLVLFIYTAEPGSSSAERLHLLASWAAPTRTPMDN